MKFFWWRKRGKAARDTQAGESGSSVDDAVAASRFERMRNGQDVETEQVIANLRNWPGP